jgi:dethiobiotin synthetase
VSTLFVTASGTEIGKTFVCRRLIAELKAAGQPLRAVKPVASGFDADDPGGTDTVLLLKALGIDPTPERIDATTPWRFRLPLSPDMAASREGRTIDFDGLVAFCRSTQPGALTLIEGIGGVMTPIGERLTVLDWIAALRCPALLVTGGYLGTLSHTLTAAGMLAARKVDVAAIIVNASPELPVPVEETAATLRRFVPGVPVVPMARQAPASGEPPRLLPLVDGLIGQ